MNDNKLTVRSVITALIFVGVSFGVYALLEYVFTDVIKSFANYSQLIASIVAVVIFFILEVYLQLWIFELLDKITRKK